ncbi:hypothetical protein [Agrobacterium cavarae]|uniref:hypothetical protein n=1 Tax=Agrobacterium cavarae TaxID=2528239 RepID=UPI00289F649B|nr:hypothetical protein [Agrobacterium cavarae]
MDVSPEFWRETVKAWGASQFGQKDLKEPRTAASACCKIAAQESDCCIAQTICQMPLFQHTLLNGKSKNTKKTKKTGIARRRGWEDMAARPLSRNTPTGGFITPGPAPM